MVSQTLLKCSRPLAQYQAHKEEIDAAIQRVMNSGEYILGREVSDFEEEFARYIGVKYAIGVNSGTDALIIALRALGLKSVTMRDDTALATLSATIAAGVTPLLVDSDRLQTSLSVHLYGKASWTDTIIEDCAQSCGGYFNGQRLGSFGKVGCFSFYPTKNLGAIGDGGMIVTSDIELALKCRQMREYGWDKNRIPQRVGVNSRLDPLQAAILRVKLKYLDEDNNKRRHIAKWYDEALAEVVATQAPDNHCYNLYVIRCAKRDELALHLLKLGIQTAVHYPTPLHLEPVYKDLIWQWDGDLTKIEDRAKTILSLPMYPELTEEEVDRVIWGVIRFYR